MSLVQALQGAPKSFSGYTTALGKKEERDFLSKEAELKSIRATSMEELKQSNYKTNQTAQFGQQDKTLDTQQGYNVTNEASRRQSNLDVANQQFSNSKELSDHKLAGETKAYDAKKEKNAKYFLENTAPSMIEAGFNQAQVDIAEAGYRNGENIQPMITAMITARGKGGITQKDIADIKLKAVSTANETVKEMRNDPAITEKYMQAKTQYPAGTSMPDIVASEYLIMVGQDPLIAKKKGLINLLDPDKITDAAEKYNRGISGNGTKANGKAWLKSQGLSEASIKRILKKADSLKEPEATAMAGPEGSKQYEPLGFGEAWDRIKPEDTGQGSSLTQENKDKFSMIDPTTGKYRQ